MIRCKEFMVQGFVPEDEQVKIILKLERLGYGCSFDEYSELTFITIIKNKDYMNNKCKDCKYAEERNFARSYQHGENIGLYCKLGRMRVNSRAQVECFKPKK